MSGAAAGASSRSAQVALIGDLHGSWDAVDEQYFDASEYELLLFTGDLGSGTRENGVQIARSVARLGKPALVMPGNNDAPLFAQIASELAHQRGLIELMNLGTEAPPRSLRNAAGRAELCGYSLHKLVFAGRDVTLLAGRPFGMGGPELSFAERLEELHGITSLQQSARKLCDLVDQAPTQDLLVLSHNGPLGLGDEPTDLWGCDFKPEAGDWGDPDLAEALAHAKARGKRVLAVIAGHMHLHTRQGQERTWQRRHDGVLFVNPARVPRIYADRSGELRHHAVLELTARGDEPIEVSVREVSVGA